MTDKLDYLLLILALVATAGLGYFFFQTDPPDILTFQKIQQTTHQAVTPDPTPTPKPPYQTITTTRAIFKTQALLPYRERTHLMIPFKTDQPHQEIWLSLQTQSDQEEIILLIDHPIFQELNWPKLVNQQYTLFQKEVNYQSMEEFLSNPPPADQIVADYPLINRGIVPVGSKALEKSTNFNNFQYFLTTYRPHEYQNDFLVYRTVFDSSTGQLNEQDQLTWVFNMPSISPENKLYLKNIHVDFRLPF